MRTRSYSYSASAGVPSLCTCVQSTSIPGIPDDSFAPRNDKAMDRRTSRVTTATTGRVIHALHPLQCMKHAPVSAPMLRSH